MFALALQPVLEVASGVHPKCLIVVYADQICIQGPQSAVECVFRRRCTALLPLRPCVHPVKCKLYCAEEAVTKETAAKFDEVANKVKGLIMSHLKQPASRFLNDNLATSTGADDKS